MGQIKSIIVIVAICLLSFLEQSGWAATVRLPEKVNMIIAIISAIYYFRAPQNRLCISSGFVLLLVLSFIIFPYFLHNSTQGASYLVAFLVVYILSQADITGFVIKYSALIVGGFGLVVLNIFLTGSFLSGWNDNGISMVGLFSFAYFSIFLVLKNGTKQFWLYNVVTLLYLSYLFKMDCRSGMLFSVLIVVCIVFSSTVNHYLNNKSLRVLLLNLPLIIGFLVIWIASTSVFQGLDQWSMEEFHKPIFNGRDLLWNSAIEVLEKSYFIGTGKFLINYHNSAIAAISVFGVLGYICWIKFFSINLTRLSEYLSDSIVLGSMLAFCMIFLQQSVDLGFISQTPNLLPYAILGVGLGRVRYLEELEDEEG